MRRTVFNIISIIAAFVLQTSFFPFTGLFTVSPNLTLMIVSSVSFVFGGFQGMLYGVLSGFLLDLFYGQPLGFFTLIFVMIAFLNSRLSRYYYDEYFALPIVLCIVNDFFYNLFIFVFRSFFAQTGGFFYCLTKIIIPEIVISVVFTLILYRPFLWVNIRLKQIDEAKVKKSAA